MTKLTETIIIKVSEEEKKIIQEYCKKNDIKISFFGRYLMKNCIQKNNCWSTQTYKCSMCERGEKNECAHVH